MSDVSTLDTLTEDKERLGVLLAGVGMVVGRDED